VSERIRREFRFGSLVLADPDPAKSPDEVRKHYGANGHPQLTNGSVGEPKTENGRQVYEFSAAVGKKG
jgi:PRTRC genetic system protein C